VTEGEISKTGAAEEELRFVSGFIDTVPFGSEYSCFDYTIIDNQIRVLWVTGLLDSNFWIIEDGVFFTIEGTVNECVENGEYLFTIEPINRPNADIVLGYIDYLNFGNTNSNNYVSYSVQRDNGSLIVESHNVDEFFSIEIIENDGVDVIRISNDTDNAISGKGLYLSDDTNDLFKWQMPSIIVRSGESILIRSSDDGTTQVLKRAQVNFNITSTTAIYLTGISSVCNRE
jgi:hypothetical protein